MGGPVVGNGEKHPRAIGVALLDGSLLGFQRMRKRSEPARIAMELPAAEIAFEKPEALFVHWTRGERDAQRASAAGCESPDGYHGFEPTSPVPGASWVKFDL